MILNFSRLFPLWLLLAPSLILRVNGNATGASTTPETCDNMTPNHGEANKPQRGPSPYYIRLNRVVVRGGDMIKLMIGGHHSMDKIKGFYLQARKLTFDPYAAFANLGTTPMGTFVLEKTYSGAKLGTCGTKEGNVVTHVDNSDKDFVMVEFMAPKDPGVYVILCTLVKSGTTFWVKQPSVRITVLPY